MSYIYRPRDQAEPKYRGLNNQGSTCYLNSALQVLFMTEEFRDAVESETSHTNYIDADLKDVFLQLKTAEGSPTTKYIIRRLGIENVWKQQDAAEYFEKMLNLASPEASQVFRGRLIHRTSCSCGERTDEHNSFWTLNLPMHNANNGVYKVEDGLKQFFRQSKLTGDNQVYCDECEAKADTTTECEVELYPKVLVLLLKRFEFSYSEMDYVKNDSPVDVPLNIKMPKGVSYVLYATVDHVGTLSGGHYTATIQSPDNGGSWYNFNDSMVTPKNNFNSEKSKNGYLLFYRKTQMSESPQVHHHGSSVDPDELETNQNHADHDSDDHFHTPPSSSGPLDVEPERAGWVVPESGEVTRGDEVTEGVDAPERGEVTQGDEVMGGDSRPMESERLDRKVPTNEKESRKPGDQAVQQEASGAAPMVRDPEVVVNERKWRDQRESTALWDVEGEGEDDETQKTDDGNADRDSDGDDNDPTPSSSGPLDKRPVSAWRGDGTGGDDVREEVECGGEDRAGDEDGAGDPQPMEIEGLDGMGGEGMTTDVEVPTNEKESREPGTALLNVFEGAATEGDVFQKNHRKGIDDQNRFSPSRMCCCIRQRYPKRKRGQGNKVDVFKEKKSIKKRRKKKNLMCWKKQTSDSE